MYTPEEQLTIDYYNREAETWKQGRDTSDFWLPEIQKLQELVPSGSVLEIGSGVGKEAQHLAQYYSYTGTDVSTGLLQIARERNPHLTFVEADAYQLPFGDGEFDAVWSAATLIHIPKSRIDAALAEIYRVMKPGAMGFVSVKRGGGEETIEGVAYGRPSKRFYSYYTEDMLSERLTSQGFSVLELSQKSASSRTLAKGQKTLPSTIWLSCFFRKP